MNKILSNLTFGEQVKMNKILSNYLTCDVHSDR